MLVYIHIYIYIYSPHGFTVWNARNVPCLSTYEIVKCGLILADGFKIILDLVKLYNGKDTILDSKIKYLFY